MFHDKDTDMIKRMTWDSLPGCCSPVSERTKDQIPNVRATTVSTHLHFKVLSCIQGFMQGDSLLTRLYSLLLCWQVSF